MKRLVILRPQPGAQASVESARALGIEALARPLFAVSPTPWTPPDATRFDAIVATSANAFRHGGDGLAALRGLPVRAVGEATAEAARAAGFGVIEVGDGGADAMIPIAPGERWLRLAGREHRPIGGIETIVVYASDPIDPPPDLSILDGQVVAVHSPRAGRRLAAIVGARDSIRVAAISAAAAEACGGGWKEIAIAESPRDSALLALARDLCQKP